MSAHQNINFPQFKEHLPDHGRQGQLFMRPSEILEHYPATDWPASPEHPWWSGPNPQENQENWDKKLDEATDQDSWYTRAHQQWGASGTLMDAVRRQDPSVPPVQLARGHVVSHHRLAVARALEHERGEYYAPVQED